VKPDDTPFPFPIGRSGVSCHLDVGGCWLAGCMPAILDLPPEAALEFELAALAGFEGMIRHIQAEQYRRVQRAVPF
jgi:hypothetical protein